MGFQIKRGKHKGKSIHIRANKTFYLQHVQEIQRTYERISFHLWYEKKKEII